MAGISFASLRLRVTNLLKKRLIGGEPLAALRPFDQPEISTSDLPLQRRARYRSTNWPVINNLEFFCFFFIVDHQRSRLFFNARRINMQLHDKIWWPYYGSEQSALLCFKEENHGKQTTDFTQILTQHNFEFCINRSLNQKILESPEKFPIDNFLHFG